MWTPKKVQELEAQTGQSFQPKSFKELEAEFGKMGALVVMQMRNQQAK